MQSNSKPTNPKDSVSIEKAPISTVSFAVMAEVGVAMLEGARKYGRHNYREAGVRASVYIDATINRHLGPWWEGEDIDPDSGMSHITKAIASLTVLRDSMIRDNWVDDRPPGTVGYIKELNEKVKEIQARTPNAKPDVTANGREPARYHSGSQPLCQSKLPITPIEADTDYVTSRLREAFESPS